MDDELTPATFEPHVGDEFAVLGDDGLPALVLVLDSVEAHPAAPGAPRAQPFSLVFVGDAGGHLPQQIYRLRHASLGEQHIFLVPLGPRPDGRHRYEALFN